MVPENDPRLLSVFSLIPVNPCHAVDLNEGGAFVDWLLAEEMRGLTCACRPAEHRFPRFLQRDQIPPIEPG
jgi:ABC-type tungstate transport system permease subunit